VRNPRYATAMGLLQEGAWQIQQGRVSRQNGSVRAVFGRMRDWFQKNF
jgi:cell division protein FtsA